MTGSTHDAVWEFDAIGTRWRIHTPDPLPDEARDRVRAVITDYDLTFSRFRADSLVARMSWDAGTWELPAYAVPLFDMYARVSALTDGAVNPLVGASLSHLGYGADISLRRHPGALPSPRFESVCSLEDNVLTTTEPITLDVGAVGKGQLADLVHAELVSCGMVETLVDAGGDIVCSGTRRLGVEDPFDFSRVLAAVTVTDGALCGSSTRRRAWGEDLHHVLDARTGTPIRGVTAAYASGPDALTADAATTALFFASPNAVASALGVETFVMLDDGRAAWSVDGTLGAGLGHGAEGADDAGVSGGGVPAVGHHHGPRQWEVWA